MPDSYADVGCGPASVPFAVTEQCPETTVVGFDAAEPIVERNRGEADRETLRFEAVLSGESLLSYRRIQATLGAWPQSIWSVVDDERYPAWQQNPLVFVPKP